MFFSKIKSLISIFIISLLVLGLVLSLSVGTDIMSFGMSDKVIAKVNKKDITLEEFNYFRGLRFSELPKEVLSDKDSLEIIDREIVNTIARRKVLAHEALKFGLFVSDVEIKDKIKNTNLFNTNNEFIGYEAYRLRVKDTFGLSTEIFEQILREEALADKLEYFFSSFVSVSDNEIKQKYVNDFTKINFYIVRASSEDYIEPIFTDKQVDSYIKNKEALSLNESVSFRTAILSYKDLTKNIKISQKDIDSFILNYSSDDSISDEKAKILIRKRIALNIFPKKFEYLSKLSETKSFNEIIEELGILELQEGINLESSNKLVAKDLIEQIKATKFDTGKAKIFFANDSIWIVSLTSKNTYSTEEAIERLKEKDLIAYKNTLLISLISENELDDKATLESIKGSRNFSYEYNYDINFADFAKISDYQVGFQSIKEGEFVSKIIETDADNFLIFIERIRKANSDFILLDKDKIKKDLSLPRKKKIYSRFLSEIFNNSTIKYNTKYID